MRWTALGVLCAVVIAAPVAAVSAPVVGDATTIAISDASGPPGDYVPVLLYVEARNVTAYDANVTFDPAVLDVSIAMSADFPTPDATINSDAGWVRLHSERASGADFPTLASLLVRVRPDAEPATTARLSFVPADTRLTNASGGEIPIDSYRAGSVDVTEPPTTPTPPPGASTTPTPVETPTPTPTVTPTTSPTPTATPSTTPLTPTPTASSPTPTAQSTPATTQVRPVTTGTSTAPPSRTTIQTRSTTGTVRTTTTATGPGFGIGATAAVCVAVALALRRRTR